MSENKEQGYGNIESPYELFKAAQRDILTIKSIIKDEDVQFEDNVETICRCAAESVEKMLKGWIINTNDNIKVYGIHDLNKLIDIATNMNDSFKKLEDGIINLNNYTPKLRYNSRFTIEKHEVKESLKNLKNVYDFPLIRELRDKTNTDNNFIKIPDNINLLFGEFGQNNTLTENEFTSN